MDAPWTPRFGPFDPEPASVGHRTDVVLIGMIFAGTPVAVKAIREFVCAIHRRVSLGQSQGADYRDSDIYYVSKFQLHPFNDFAFLHETSMRLTNIHGAARVPERPWPAVVGLAGTLAIPPVTCLTMRGVTGWNDDARVLTGSPPSRVRSSHGTSKTAC